MSTPFTVENIQAWTEANPRLVEDQHNTDLMLQFVKYMKDKGRESELSVESLSAFVSLNASNFHWLRDENEIRQAAEAARIAATPPPEPPKQPEKLKGLTIAERLANVGVAASPHQSHADKRENDAKASGAVKKVLNDISQVQRNLEREARNEAARNKCIYRADGRVDHAATADAKRNALKALGISE